MTISLFRTPVLIPVCVLVTQLGCSSDAKKQEAPEATKVADGIAGKTANAAPGAPAPKPSMRPKLASYRPLLTESARAELDVDGLLVDFGTADQHKYTRGGWNAGWAVAKVDKATGVTYAPADARKSDVDVLISEGQTVKEIVIRGRTAVAGQVLTVYVDGNRVGDGTLTSDWSTIRIPATGLTPGRHGLDYVFSKSGPVRADIDWMWLAKDAGKPEPTVTPRSLPVRISNSPRRSLIAPTPRTYSYYLEVPDNAKLLVDYGAKGNTTFHVSARADGDKEKELWTAKGEERWQEAAIDLSSYAGKAFRLSLRTTGDAGVAGWGEPEIMLADVGSAPMKSGPKPKNVILILMDTNRADNFKAYNPKTVVKTPAFDKLASQSLVFENAYNQENWTKPSVATTLTGTYPDTHQTKKDSSALPKEVELISERLQSEGFQTAGFVANGYISEKFGFEKGWDVFKNYIRESKPSQAEFVYGDAAEWLTTNKDKKFFLYIQTIDPHVPYRDKAATTAQYFDGTYNGRLGKSISAEQQIAAGKKPLSATDQAWLKAMYYGETTHHDTHMGAFFDKLDELGLSDNTMVIVTNDHGEELGDHGKYGHGHSLYEELLRAPLLVRFPPTIRASVLSHEVVENVDVAPTIIDALGLKPMQKADGMSLLPLMRQEPVQRPYYAISEFMESRRAIRAGSWKMIWAAGTTVNVYHSTKDRGEEKDLAKTALVARRMLEVYAGEAQAAFDKKQRLQDIATKRQFKAGKADIDPETRKQLEALGYFGE